MTRYNRAVKKIKELGRSMKHKATGWTLKLKQPTMLAAPVRRLGGAAVGLMHSNRVPRGIQFGLNLASGWTLKFKDALMGNLKFACKKLLVPVAAANIQLNEAILAAIRESTLMEADPKQPIGDRIGEEDFEEEDSEEEDFEDEDSEEDDSEEEDSEEDDSEEDNSEEEDDGLEPGEIRRKIVTLGEDDH